MNYFALPGIGFPTEMNNAKARIRESVVLETGLSWKDICRKGRKRECVEARMITHHLLRKYAKGMGYREIGLFCGKLNHATAINSVKTVDDLLKYNAEFKAKYKAVESRVMRVDNDSPSIYEFSNMENWDKAKSIRNL